MLPQEKICCCPMIVTQFGSEICQRFSMHPSPLMRDSPRRVKWLSAPLSVEVIELNFSQISRLRCLSALLCCRERLSDYHTIKYEIYSYPPKSDFWSIQLCVLVLSESEQCRWLLRKNGWRSIQKDDAMLVLKDLKLDFPKLLTMCNHI